MKDQCRVYFIGAGPGDPELITLKGDRLIRQADLVLYAGSLVPKSVVAGARKDARVLDSSPMTLEEIHSLVVETVGSGKMVARVHTGDPSLYGALKEQMHLLDREGIRYEIVPGVTAAFAAAAAAGVSFTLPEKTQTLILTRMAGRTPVPETERLRELAGHRTSIAVYLSASDPQGLQDELVSAGYPADTPVVVAFRVGWPDQKMVATCLSGLSAAARELNVTGQTVFLILPGQEDEPRFSRLYSRDFSHGFRKEE